MKYNSRTTKLFLSLCLITTLLLQTGTATVLASPQKTSAENARSEPSKETVPEVNSEPSKVTAPEVNAELSKETVPEVDSQLPEDIVSEENSKDKRSTKDTSITDSDSENKITAYSTATNEWTGQAVSSGAWVISAGNTVNITSSENLYFENAELTIEEGAFLFVEAGVLRFNNATVKGTVNIIGDGTVRPWGDFEESTKIQHIVVDGGTLWGAFGASIKKIELKAGDAELFGASVDECIQDGGTLLVTDPYDAYSNLKNYTLNDGIMNCGNGGKIQNATIKGGSAIIFTDAQSGRAGSIDQVNLSAMGYLWLYDEAATVNSVNMQWGSDFSHADFPKIENYGTITKFEGSGGYVENFSNVTNVTLLDDVQNTNGVDFRNGLWSEDKYGQVEKLTMDYGSFFNSTSSILNSATVYDGFIYQSSSEPIPYIELLASKNPGKDEVSPNGASLIVFGPSVIDTLKFAQGDLSLYDDENEGAVIKTLSKTSDFAGVIYMERYAQIGSELTGMASVSWNEPLNGSIKVVMDGQELLPGSLIADGSTITISALPTDDTIYKLRSNSLTANDTAIREGIYKVKGDTVFSAAFMLKTAAQPWDGATSITTADNYEVTQPIVITDERSICEAAEVYLTGNGSITVSGSGVLTNKGTIYGLVTLSDRRARMAQDNLNNEGTIEKVKSGAGTNLVNSGIIGTLDIAGGNAKNHKEINVLSITQNGVLQNNAATALVKDATIASGTLRNGSGAVIDALVMNGGLTENIGSTIRKMSLNKGKIVNKNDGISISTIESMEAQSGTIENGEGAYINKLKLLADNSVILENKGIIQEQTGEIITGYRLDNNTITVTENAYFNKDPSITITWNPVVPIGSNTTAPVEYHLRIYDNKNLSGEAVSDVIYSAKTTSGGASGKKLKSNTTYYLLLEAKVVGGNVEKDKIFTYETQSVTTLPDPEEIGALNTDKITLKPGASFQFKAYDALGKPVTTIPLSWGVEGYPGNKMSSKETVISKEGLLRVGEDETAKQLLVSCGRADGYFTTYTAVVTISDVAPTLYPITVNATEGGKAWATVDAAEEEAYVLLFAEAKEGYKLDGWQTSAGEILLPTNDTPFTRLSMPNEAVTVTAHFVKVTKPDTEPSGGTDTRKSVSPVTGDKTNYEMFILLIMSSFIMIMLSKIKRR